MSFIHTWECRTKIQQGGTTVEKEKKGKHQQNGSSTNDQQIEILLIFFIGPRIRNRFNFLTMMSCG